MTKAVKITLIVVGASMLGLVLLVGTCIGGIMMLTKGPAEVADKLVQLCGANKIHEAYELTAPGFREKTDEAAFKAFVEHAGLDKAVSASWPERKIVNSGGHVAGTVRTSDGKSVDLEVNSVHQGDHWLIVGINGGNDGE